MSQPGQLARFGLYAVVLTGAFPIVGLTWHIDRTMALALLAIAIGATAALVAGLMADTVVELAPIGLTVNWLGRKRLLAYGAIESIRMIDEAADWAAGTRTQPYLAIAMKSGEVVRLPVGDAPSEAIRDFLRKARRALTQRPATPVEAAVQHRAGGVHGWFESLRDLATTAGPATHRTAPLGPDALSGGSSKTTARPPTRAPARPSPWSARSATTPRRGFESPRSPRPRDFGSRSRPPLTQRRTPSSQASPRRGCRARRRRQRGRVVLPGGRARPSGHPIL